MHAISSMQSFRKRKYPADCRSPSQLRQGELVTVMGDSLTKVQTGDKLRIPAADLPPLRLKTHLLLKILLANSEIPESNWG